MDRIIELIGSFILFLSKIFLRQSKLEKKRIGWILGIIGISLISIPTYKKALWISLGYNAGLVILMVYGYTLTKIPKDYLVGFWKFFLRFVIIVATLVFCIYLFIDAANSKNFNLAQLAQSVSGLTGSLFLAMDTRKSNMTGWSANIVSHFFASYIFWQKDLWFMLAFQIASVVVTIGAIKELKKTPPPEV